MRLFDFLIILDSIIIGLGLAEILQGLGQLLRAKWRTRVYGPHAVFVVLVFVGLLQHWWNAWGLRGMEEMNFFLLLLFVSGPVLLFLLAYLAFPAVVKDWDLQDYYYTYSPLLWGMAAFYLFSAMIFRPVAFGEEVWSPENIVRGAALVICATLAASKSKRVHTWGVTAAMLLMALYVIGYTFRLSQ